MSETATIGQSCASVRSAWQAQLLTLAFEQLDGAAHRASTRQQAKANAAHTQHT
jgi:hypothetical protein